MSVLRARKRAERLAAECGAKAPVDVEAVARHVGLRVVPSPLGGDISGLLVTRNGVSTICVEERHHEENPPPGSARNPPAPANTVFPGNSV